MPKPAAASTLKVGMPMTLHQAPAPDGPASKAIARVVELVTEYAAPAWSPPPGRIPANTGTVGSRLEEGLLFCMPLILDWSSALSRALSAA